MRPTIRGVVAPSILLLGALFSAMAQDGTKSIKSEEYLDKRPQSSKSEAGSQASATRKTRPFVYAVDKNFPDGPAPRGQEFVRIGVTIWRFGPMQCAIPNCPVVAGRDKGLMDTATGTRVDDAAALSTGERVRLGLESLSHDGFVYIINREQFADGTLGDAYLIFPTRNINNGNNYARPGLQIQLPRADGCFCVKSRNPQKTLVADNLVVVVSPKPLLAPDEIGMKEIALPPRFSSYLRRADNERSFRGTLKDGTGLAQTASEHNAGTKGLFDTEPVLTQNDLPPQNFYQSLVPRGSVAVFSLYLRYDRKP
jgi:hypothetical protein